MDNERFCTKKSILIALLMQFCALMYFATCFASEKMYIKGDDLKGMLKVARPEGQRGEGHSSGQRSGQRGRLPEGGLQMPAFLVFGRGGCLAGIYTTAELDSLAMECLPDSEPWSLSHLLASQRPGTVEEDFGLSADGNNVVIFSLSMMAANCRDCASARADLRAVLREKGLEAHIADADMRH